MRPFALFCRNIANRPCGILSYTVISNRVISGVVAPQGGGDATWTPNRIDLGPPKDTPFRETRPHEIIQLHRSGTFTEGSEQQRRNDVQLGRSCSLVSAPAHSTLGLRACCPSLRSVGFRCPIGSYHCSGPDCRYWLLRFLRQSPAAQW